VCGRGVCGSRREEYRECCAALLVFCAVHRHRDRRVVIFQTGKVGVPEFSESAGVLVISPHACLRCVTGALPGSHVAVVDLLGEVEVYSLHFW